MELSDSARKILEILAKSKDPVRTGELKREVGLKSPTSMNRALKRLYENKPKLIQRERVGYSITPEGREELGKLEDQRFIYKQAKYLSSPLHLTVDAQELQHYLSATASPWTVFMPTPAEIHASFSASEEVSHVIEIELPDYFYGRFPTQTRQLQNAIGDHASNIINGLIWTQVRNLAGRYRQNPEPLTPDNLLDFNVSTTIRFEGKKIVKDAKLTQTEYNRIKHRITAMLLLKIAHYEEGDISNHTILDCMIQGRLLDEKEGETLKKVYSSYHHEKRTIDGGLVGHTEGRKEPRMLKTFHGAVVRHLVLGGSVECSGLLDSGQKCGNYLHWKIDKGILICQKCTQDYDLRYAWELDERFPEKELEKIDRELMTRKLDTLPRYQAIHGERRRTDVDKLSEKT